MNEFNDFEETYENTKPNKLKDLLSNKKLVFIIVSSLVIILLLFGVLSLFKDDEEEYYVSLMGEESILIYEGTNYIEPGYKGYDGDDNDLTTEVNVTSNVDTSRPGNYIITYELNGIKVERNVKVIPKEAITTTIELKGESTIYLSASDKYEEKGYTATDIVDGDITNKVTIYNNVNYNKPGTYQIVYSVVNSSGITVSTYRNIIILGSTITLTLSNDKETTGPININVTITDDYFDYLILPNGRKVTSKAYSYKITKNGTYKFVSYDTHGTKTEKSITVTNIKEITDALISLSLSNNKETSDPININVKVTDDNFSYLVLPNGSKVTTKTYSYRVITNGTYKFIYYNKNGTKTEKSITVTNIVYASSDKITLKLSQTSKTTGPININVTITDDNFSYLVLPSGSKVTSKTYSYGVTTNGTYKFIYYNKYGSKAEKSITISNIVSVPSVNVYTSDNIKSGNTHNVGFQIKLTSNASSIYYCLDSNNTCNPNIKYTDQLSFASSTSKYLRYTSCNSEGACNSPKSYRIVLTINLVNPSVSTSTTKRYGIANPYQAAYYYQCDSRWSSYDVYSGVTMCRVGCGYNAYAMILTGITHDYTITPKTLFQQLKTFRTTYDLEFQSKSTGGGILNRAIHNNTYMKEKYGYESSELWDDYNYTTSATVKKETITEVLKMGHMIFIRVPVHFVALVGIDENDKIYVFDPSTNGTNMLTTSEFYSKYNNYSNRCSDGIECGFKIAYEVYPKGGMSLEQWEKIG